jgi:hypothetical protein
VREEEGVKRSMETQSGAVAGAAKTTTTTEQAILMEKCEDKKKKMKVMVAIDESDGSFYALKWALDHLFGSMGVAPETNPEEVGTVVMVHVQQPFQQYVFPAGPGGAGSYSRELDMSTQGTCQINYVVKLLLLFVFNLISL